MRIQLARYIFGENNDPELDFPIQKAINVEQWWHHAERFNTNQLNTKSNDTHNYMNSHPKCVSELDLYVANHFAKGKTIAPLKVYKL